MQLPTPRPRHALPTALQMALCGMAPEVTLASALASVHFYINQQQLLVCMHAAEGSGAAGVHAYLAGRAHPAGPHRMHPNQAEELCVCVWLGEGGGGCQQTAAAAERLLLWHRFGFVPNGSRPGGTVGLFGPAVTQAEVREAQLGKKISKVQEACRKKLEEVHGGYVQVCRHALSRETMFQWRAHDARL